MRIHAVPAGLLLAGLVSLGLRTGFAYTDHPAPEASAPAGAESGDPAAGKASGKLRQAGLPLSFLTSGVEDLTDGSAQLDDGAHQLSDGLGQARAGGAQLADGLAQLDDGLGLLGDGATQVSGGVDEVVGRLTEFGTMQASVTSRMSALADVLGAQPGPVARTTADDLRALVHTIDSEGVGPETLARLDQLQGGAQQLAFELTDPSARFVAGLTQAADGAGQLRDGLVQLDDGGHALTDGTGWLTEGVGPVSGIVEGIADNVKAASAALAGQPKPAPAAAPETSGSDRDRAWWPYALIAAGAVTLAVPAVRATIAPRPAHAA